MSSTRVRSAFGLAVVIAFASQSVAPSFAGSAESQIVSRELRSANFAHNKIGTNPVRKMAVYLPGGHEGSSIRYPVIYFLPSPSGSYRSLFDQNGAQGLFDRAIAAGVIGKFILVSVDMTTPIGASWYVNSPTTGNWEDFMVKELVPYIDSEFQNIIQQGFPRHCGRFSWGDMARFVSVCGIRMSLALCMRYIPSGPGQAFKSCIHGPIGVFWPMPNLWTT